MNADKNNKRRRVDVSMFGESSGNADVKLVVEGTSIPVIKTVLGVASPVFTAMFEHDFKEKDQNEIKLPEKKLDDVLTLLKCIYPNILLTVTADVVKQIDELAISRFEYKTDDVKSLDLGDPLRSYLNSFPYRYASDVSSHLKGLRLAYSYGQCKDSKISTVSKIRNDKRGVHWQHEEEYKLLPEHIKRDIECEPTQNVE